MTLPLDVREAFDDALVSSLDANEFFRALEVATAIRWARSIG